MLPHVTQEPVQSQGTILLTKGREEGNQVTLMPSISGVDRDTLILVMFAVYFHLRRGMRQKIMQSGPPLHLLRAKPALLIHVRKQ